MSNDVAAINDLVQRESAFVDSLLHEVHKVVVGQDVMIERILIGLLTGGHILLEGVPGLAKTLTVEQIGLMVIARASHNAQPLVCIQHCMPPRASRCPASRAHSALHATKSCD